MSDEGGSTFHRTERKTQLEQLLGKVKPVNEYLADVVELVKNSSLKDAVAEALPWAAEIGKALAELTGPVRFLVKLFEVWTRIDDPHELGYLACRMAYQQAVEQALRSLAYVHELEQRQLRTGLREQTARASYDFSGFSYESAFAHPFLQDSERFLGVFARELGLDAAMAEKLRRDVYIRFLTHLRVLLCHGATRDKMAPFRELLESRSGEADAYRALVQHADFQRWLFEEMPVLGTEPFSLARVYVDSDCGKLGWGQLDTAGRHPGGERPDPFDEEMGGRHSLLETLLELIGEPGFKDAIVIQGPAGAGKSSLTLRLCWELVSQGLRPIRIALKDLDTRESVSIEEALPAAVRIDAAERNPQAEREFFGSKLFRGNAIFEESVQFRRARICPHVLILDGWDEISIGAEGGYQQQVERMLRDVRQTFLERRAVPVRVILTGRPTDAIEKSKFLRKDSVLLTLRPRTPEQLDHYIDRLRCAVEEAPETLGTTQVWKALAQKREELDRMAERYRGDWERRSAGPEQDTSGSLVVLGSPLLAHLALRLMVQWPGTVEPLLDNTTLLYRSLVDMVIAKGGKPDEAPYNPEDRPQFTGDTLRELLRKTAEAMALLGKESLTYEELSQWLQVEGQELERRSGSLDENVLSRLMVSFFFRGGHRHLGCEFTHKSFREYLFAEKIVERLKQYGRETAGWLPERPSEGYWRDFDDDDPRHSLCHDLAYLLGPQWVSREVRSHIWRLVKWEIARAAGKDPYPAPGLQTPRLAESGWERVRDGLVDAWDWWGEGVHLRPRLTALGGRNRGYEMDVPLAVEIIESLRVRPLDPKNFRPERTVTIDSHLGDGLILLTQVVHFELLMRQGYPGVKNPRRKWDAPTWEFVEYRRRYQRRVQSEGKDWILFAPSGLSEEYFKMYIHRINAAGFRPKGDFPKYISLECTYCSGVNLTEAVISTACISGADFSRADLRGANLSRVDFRGASFNQADVRGANLGKSNLSEAEFREAELREADLREANLSKADLSGADLREANLRHAKLRHANFSGADLSGADLSGADIRGAILSREQLQSVRTESTRGTDEIRQPSH